VRVLTARLYCATLPSRFASLAILIAVLVAGCDRYVVRAQRAYHDGRYLEAAERLAQHQQELSELPPRRQAEYGLYLGLSLLMLGEIEGARRWLSYAYEVERAEPGALRPEQRAELDRGWAQLSAALAAARAVEQAVPAVPVLPAPAPSVEPAPPPQQL
jgi:hypothetical protein